MKIAMIGVRALGYPAGIDTYVTEVATRLVKKGHGVTVFCQSPYAKDIVLHEGVRFVVVRTIANKHLGTPVYAVLATVRMMFGRYDVVQYHGLGSAFCSIIPRLFGRKTVVTPHALDWEGQKWGFVARRVLILIGWMVSRVPHRTTVVSKVVQSHFMDRYGRSVEYIPNGASILPPLGPELIGRFGLGRRNYILFLGRLTSGKGCEYLMEAYRRLKTDLKLVVAGDTMHDRGYMEMLRRLGGPGVIFTGWVKGDMKRELLSNAYLFVQPSELEGMSGVLLEAMSYGLCAVASDIPQNLEVIGDAGVSFRNKDVEALRRTIESLIDDDERVERLGSLARERISKCYNWDEIAGMWEGLYGSLVG